MAKERLDVLVVKNKIAKSRSEAKAIIMTGKLLVNDEPETKAGKKVDVDSKIRYKGKKKKYVSRGGLKLEKAMKEFKIDFNEKICLDIGSSTGGFTDCMLKNGAKKVYAIDVGTNQLVWKLRNDDRVIVMEKTNARYLEPNDLKDKGDFASFDVAFISLKKVILPVKDLLNDDGEMVCLIKPQFEAGKEKVGKNGIVRNKETHEEVIKGILNFVTSNELNVLDITFSPIKGGGGNIEYLIYLTKRDIESKEVDVSSLVKKAFGRL